MVLVEPDIAGIMWGISINELRFNSFLFFFSVSVSYSVMQLRCI